MLIQLQWVQLLGSYYDPRLYKKGCFQDSVSLMIISRKLSESENVDDVSVMMGTPANKSLLETTGFWHDDFPRRRRMIFAWRSVPTAMMTEWLAYRTTG
jgi:hypothetical protein